MASWPPMRNSDIGYGGGRRPVSEKWRCVLRWCIEWFARRDAVPRGLSDRPDELVPRRRFRGKDNRAPVEPPPATAATPFAPRRALAREGTAALFQRQNQARSNPTSYPGNRRSGLRQSLGRTYPGSPVAAPA